MSVQIDRPEHFADLKLRASRLSVGCATALALLKLIVGFSINSIGIIAMALDSVMDIIMSLVNYAGIRMAAQPADDSHPFGHGKFETMSALVQAMIVFGIGISIGQEAIMRLIRGGDPLSDLPLGIGVMALSALVSAWLAWYLRSVARRTRSVALHSDALHYSTDVWSNGGVMLALVLMHFLGWPWLDAAISLLVALYILKEAVQMLGRVFGELTEAAVPDELQERILQFAEQEPDLIDIHELRTRRSGSMLVMDMHVTVCRMFSIEHAHEAADRLEQMIRSQMDQVDVLIHIDPCNCDRELDFCQIDERSHRGET